MLERCRNENHPRYKDYGGRGIYVHPLWWKFENFLSDMGEKPPGLTLERENNDKGYSRENCRWATTKAQGINKRPRGQDKNKKILPSKYVRPLREDWSELAKQISSLEPGMIIEFEYPIEDRAKFRSLCLIYGARLHAGEWRMRTTAKENSLVCYLAPR